MTNKLENITTEDIKLNENGELELSEDLQDAIAGGVGPEDVDEEGNSGCNTGCKNTGCGVISKEVQ